MSARTVGVFALLLLPAGIQAAEPDREPPLEVILEIDGQSVDTAIGETTTATIGGARRTLKLTAKPTRRFSKSGIEFRYPSHFTYELDDETPGISIYSVEGPSAMVMVQSFPAEVGTAAAAAESVLEHLRGAYAEGLIEEKNVTLRLGGQAYRGRRLTAKLAGEQLRQELFAVEPSRAVIMIQTLLDERGAEPEETKAVRKLLAETFKAGPPVGADQ